MARSEPGWTFGQVPSGCCPLPPVEAEPQDEEDRDLIASKGLLHCCPELWCFSSLQEWGRFLEMAAADVQQLVFGARAPGGLLGEALCFL